MTNCFYRNSNVRYVETIAIGEEEHTRGISRNLDINMACVALVFQIPKTSMKSHQSRYYELFSFSFFYTKKVQKCSLNFGLLHIQYRKRKYYGRE